MTQYMMVQGPTLRKPENVEKKLIHFTNIDRLNPIYLKKSNVHLRYILLGDDYIFVDHKHLRKSGCLY